MYNSQAHQIKNKEREKTTKQTENLKHRAVVGCQIHSYVPKIRSPASPRPGKMYPTSLSSRSI